MFSAFQLPRGFLEATRKLPASFLEASLAFWKLPAGFSELQLPTLHGRFPQASCKRSGGCASFLQACVKLPPASNASRTLPASFLQSFWRLRTLSGSLREAWRRLQAFSRLRRLSGRLLEASRSISNTPVPNASRTPPEASCMLSGGLSFLAASRRLLWVPACNASRTPPGSFLQACWRPRTLSVSLLEASRSLQAFCWLRKFSAGFLDASRSFPSLHVY